MNTRERYSPKVMGVNSTVKITGSAVGGFICTTSGTISITNFDGVVVLPATAVTAGGYLPIPLYLNGIDGASSATTAGGASGTLCVG